MMPPRLPSLLVALVCTVNLNAQDVSYNRDIRPILSDHCFACHGPDKNHRKAKLRLDDRESALERKVIVPGKPGESEMITRIFSAKTDEVMPPPDAHKPLNLRQKELLKRWIEQGAVYEPHWAFIPLKPIQPPKMSCEPVDAFIQSRLKFMNLGFSPEADRVTLIRRLSFDLLGLPPTYEEVQAFVNDRSPNAWEKLVDRLLASPHYGERMAVFWLDQVRYADSIGYHSDNPMKVWPYRDYVIRSFNTNQPFSDFTREQLAGDLLPNATMDQKIGSAYNRLLQTTEEGGAQAKEYEAKYAADRVRNFGSVWLGITLGCAQCHDHKYDPVTIREFYQIAAFFADIQEAAVGARGPGMRISTAEQETRIKALETQLAEAKKKLADAEKEHLPRQAEWEKTAKVPNNIAAIIKIEPAKRNANQKTTLKNHYLSTIPAMKPMLDAVRNLEAEHQAFLDTIPTCLITQSGTPRKVRILARGNWLDDTGEVVSPGTPAMLPPITLSQPRGTRLDLANWLLQRDHPLTARVFVNRVWKLFFGFGLSRSMDDLGMQGEVPSHPELLDYLALQFIDSGWDVKKLVKQIVMSEAYRQSSRSRPELKETDPNNLLLARQNRYRIDAEFVRDNALAVSGLLVKTIGGPSVKPYQPAGYWAALNFPTREWQNDKGAGLYRRGMYTHWQRSFLHPSLVAFDAPSREECAMDRPRSNLPQQALVLLNDPSYVEAARVFGVRTIGQGGRTVEDRIRWMFRQALSRDPSVDELKLLREFVVTRTNEYRADPEAAKKLLAVGDQPTEPHAPPEEIAAWTATARVLLNLHEFITRD